MMGRDKFAHSHTLASFLQGMRKAGIVLYAVEVGVYKGETSKILLDGVPSLFLWMVDLWKAPAADSEYTKTNDRVARLSQQEQEDNYNTAIEATSFAASSRRVMRMASDEAADLIISDSSQDLVFIDAEHSYPAVKQDIELWWPKVKPGGILCGHDYSPKHWPGVVKAVNEWFAANNKQVQVAPGKVWWVRKEA